MLALSSGHFSHDQQLDDAMRYVQQNHPEQYATLLAEFPEWERRTGGPETDYRTVASENVWSNMTGKHLNYFSDKSERIPHEDFQALLSRVGAPIA